MPTLTGLFTIGHAEQRTTASGTPTLQLSLAYDYGRKGEDGRKPTQWVRAASSATDALRGELEAA